MKIAWIEFQGLGVFFGRGNWTEFALSFFAELPIGILLVAAPSVSAESRLLHLFGQPAGVIVGTAFILSASLTLAGIALFFLHKPSLALIMRFLGATGSTATWVWIAVSTAIEIGLGFFGFWLYLFCAVTSFRMMVIARDE
jgi:hypothetical protein